MGTSAYTDLPSMSVNLNILYAGAWPPSVSRQLCICDNEPIEGTVGVADVPFPLFGSGRTAPGGCIAIARNTLRRVATLPCDQSPLSPVVLWAPDDATLGYFLRCTRRCHLNQMRLLTA